MMLHLRTLGQLDLDGSSLPDAQAVLRGAKRAGLLVYLARAQPRGLKRRDILLALFWPELDEARARHALRNTLHSLRTAPRWSACHGNGRRSIASCCCHCTRIAGTGLAKGDDDL
jgi:DNA-binding SARP family transcriptional activator